MKAWRKAAHKIKELRKLILAHNDSVPRNERLHVPATAKQQARASEQVSRFEAKRGIKTTWLLSGLMIRGGYQPAP